jgi:hypothetical protein
MHLAELIQRQKEKAETSVHHIGHWRKRRDKWLSELNLVLTRIKGWLLAGGLTATDFELFEVDLNEETLGRYQATGLHVRVGAALVTFRPVGSVLIGACGRIDVTSDQPGTPSVKLIAEPATRSEDAAYRPVDQQDWVWRVYPGRTPSGGFPLDEDSLVTVLAVVLGEDA